MSVSEVRELMKRRESLPAREHPLIFTGNGAVIEAQYVLHLNPHSTTSLSRGTILENGKTLSDYGLQNGDIIFLSIRK